VYPVERNEKTMPDDIAPEPIDVVDEPVLEEPEVQEIEMTIEALGEQLLARIDALDNRLEQIESGLAGSTSPTTSEPGESPTPELEPDSRPRRDHIWFRAVNE
jgi:hypothetical protein